MQHEEDEHVRSEGSQRVKARRDGADGEDVAQGADEKGSGEVNEVG